MRTPCWHYKRTRRGLTHVGWLPPSQRSGSVRFGQIYASLTLVHALTPVIETGMGAATEMATRLEMGATAREYKESKKEIVLVKELQVVLLTAQPGLQLTMSTELTCQLSAALGGC
jgi:hypothetical protein